MKSTLKTFSIAAGTALMVMAMFSFKPAPEDGDQKRVVYEYKQFSTIESVVPGGLGRSRILTTDDNGQLVEKDLKNFYSMVGINFGNIANNDRAIVDRLNYYSSEGWELMEVSTGSHAQTSDGSSSGGVFISRYLFRRPRH
ncbi:MAG: hypothetical protein EOP56_18375 [Sphingobacteriales bacterium]|nr:MAG: hypothetical protein EOP56_18375 [Sphingobacteriales bacterium]